jgi:hypothetical protein
MYVCDRVYTQYVQCFTHPSLLEPLTIHETPAQRREKRKAERAAANQRALEEQLEKCTAHTRVTWC